MYRSGLCNAGPKNHSAIANEAGEASENRSDGPGSQMQGGKTLLIKK